MSEITGMDSVLSRLKALEQRVQADGMKQPLLRAGMVALKAAADRIDAGGPGWPPNKSHTPLLHHTGRLLRSLTANASGNVFDVNGTTIEVGTNVEYAPFLQRGTSRGLPARPFLFIDEQVASKIRDIFANYVVNGVAE